MKEIIKEDVMRKLGSLNTIGDPESAHSRADKILCELLISLGFKDVVEAYKDVKPKWYG